jgi:TolB protein
VSIHIPRRRVLIAALAGAALTALAVAVAPSHATYPGPNGLIVYQATVGDHVQLFTVRPDGSDVRQITSLTDSDAVAGSWSPDGSRIVFERDFADLTEIDTMKADGSDVEPLMPPGYVFQPSYSPHGKRIVFERTLPDGDGLWIMNLQSKHLRRITHNLPAGPDQCLCDESPVFSPDGERVAFVRTVDDLTTAVFVVGTDGHDLKQVTPWSLGVTSKLDWSPDGTKLLVSTPSFENPAASNVITIRPNGKGLTQLTHDTTPGVRNAADSFSPDGKKIVFARNDADGLQLYVMKANGSGATQITHGINAHWANWGTHP